MQKYKIHSRLHTEFKTFHKKYHTFLLSEIYLRNEGMIRFMEIKQGNRLLIC